MDIAKSKRRENIAEYILYLWQLEDLLRAPVAASAFIPLQTECRDLYVVVI